MTTDEAVNFFGGRKELADALGIWPQGIYTWGHYPPNGRQYELEIKTKGKLKAERGTVDVNG